MKCRDCGHRRGYWCHYHSDKTWETRKGCYNHTGWKNNLQNDSAEANELGMTYGKMMAKRYLNEKH